MEIYDSLIIGGGGAGLTTAIKLANLGAKTIIATKSTPTQSQTSMAQGGINSVSENEIEKHIEETLKASSGLGNEKAIRQLVENSEEAINFLKSIGVPFSGQKRRLGGVSSNRTNYIQDYTGLSIIQRLYEKVLKLEIPILENHFLLNYIIENKKVLGATFLNIATGKVIQVLAKTVIVATGGYAKIFQNFSTNSTESTGDGIATHIRNGGTLSNLEFIQFHPTALKGKGILISETARGEGAYLVNSKGERFIDELKSRDIVSQAIYSEIENGNDVFLDIRHLENVDEVMPQEIKLIKTYLGIDPKTELIPIEPVAHYTMGGIKTDSKGKTDIKGVFAVGEVANSGIHGGNRLGGNSLLELIVFGDIVAKSSFEFAKKVDSEIPKSPQLQKDMFFIKSVIHRFTNQLDFYEKREFLSKIFYRNGGIFRNEMSLKGILAIVRQYEKELTFMGVSDKSESWNRNLVEFIEFGNMVELAEVILVGAINRFESRGSHFRTDFPKSDNLNFQKNTLMWKVEGILTTEYK